METCWPILYVSQKTWYLISVYLIIECLAFISLVKRRGLKWVQNIQSWFPLFDFYLEEITSWSRTSGSFFSNHKTQWSIYWFSKTFLCSTPYCIQLFSKENNEMKAAKLIKGSKQSDLKHHIYPQPLCLGNSGHMVCKWCLEILAKSTHDGIN